MIYKKLHLQVAVELWQSLISHFSHCTSGQIQLSWI